MSDFSNLLLIVIIFILLNFCYRRSRQQSSVSTKPKAPSKPKQKPKSKVHTGESTQKKPSQTDVVVPKAPEVPVVPKEVQQPPKNEAIKTQESAQKPPEPIQNLEGEKVAANAPKPAEGKAFGEELKSSFIDENLRPKQPGFKKPTADDGAKSAFIDENLNRENKESGQLAPKVPTAVGSYNPTQYDTNIPTPTGGENAMKAPSDAVLNRTQNDGNIPTGGENPLKIPSDGSLNRTQNEGNIPTPAVGGNISTPAIGENAMITPSDGTLNRTQNDGNIPTPAVGGNVPTPAIGENAVITPSDGALNRTQNDGNIPTPTGGGNVPTAPSDEGMNRAQQDGNTAVLKPGKTGTSGEDHQPRSVGIDSTYINDHLRNEQRHPGATAVKKGTYMG